MSTGQASMTGTGAGRRELPAPRYRTLLTFGTGVTALIVVGLAARLATRSGAPDNDDAIFFIRGVRHFSVAQTQPHWPGYPVYIAAGKLVASVVGEPVAALQILSVMAVVAVAWPMAAIVRVWAGSLGTEPRRASAAGLAAAALWLVLPISWVTGTQIVSDPLGLLCGLGILALSIRGERTGRSWPWIVAAVLAGLLPGVRLVNVSMLGPLLWKAWSTRGERWRGVRVPALLAAAVVAGALPWLLWLALTDPLGYLRAGRSHLLGHFTRFGESAVTDRHLFDRPGVALSTLAIYALGAGPPSMGWVRAAASVAWVVMLVGAARRRPWRGDVGRLVTLWAVPHLAYVFIAHDVAYPRYMLGPAALVTIAAGLAVARATGAVLASLAVAIVCVAPASARIALLQARQPPVEYQAARYLARQPRPLIVGMNRGDLLDIYLPDLGRGVVWLNLDPAELAGRHRAWAADGRHVYSTTVPAEEPSAWVPVAHFCQDPMIEPLAAHDLWLFRAAPAAEAASLPECGEER
jgi:hypothetical protein